MNDEQRHERACGSAARCSATPTSTARSRATTPFTAPFQDFITRAAWGDVWARPGLDRRTRSIVTLAALVRAARRGRDRDARPRGAAATA